MKVPVFSSLLLALGFVSQAPAIERPKSLDQESPKVAGAARAVVEIEEANVEAVAEPWLGVFGESPNETLRQHLSLNGGVVLRYVVPNSPAAAAGLQAHDILLEFAGEKIDSQDNLRDAVSKFTPGDSISLNVITRGQSAERKVVLGERPADLNRGGVGGQLGMQRRMKGGEGLPNLKNRMAELRRLFPEGREGLNFGPDFQAQMERVEKHLKQLEQIPGGNLNLEHMMDDLDKLSLKRTSTVHLTDKSGSVELRLNDDSKEVTVRDLDGETVYEGPWNTEQDRAGVPPEIAERIDRLNFDGPANGIRLQFKQVPEPLEHEEEKAPE